MVFWQASLKYIPLLALRASSSSSSLSSALSSSTTTTTSSSLSSKLLMDPILNHPAVAELGMESRPRRKLKPRHAKLFQTTIPIDETNNNNNNNNINTINSNKHAMLLNELGLMACRTGVVPRKELLETYAAAIYIDAKFPQIRRIADVAAGHGLLSWFLLALDPTRSAICIDRRMPPSADIIAKEMMELLYPEFQNNNDNHDNNINEKWCYVEADLHSMECHPSTLLVSVHACGTLSDTIIEMAIGSNAPIALVPCCHTVKVKKGYSPHPLLQMDAEQVQLLVEEELEQRQQTIQKEANNNNHNNQDETNKTLGDIVDAIRCKTLHQAGYTVEEVMLPELFTKRNRLILGEKEETSQLESDNDQRQQQRQPKDDNDNHHNNNNLQSSISTTTTRRIQQQDIVIGVPGGKNQNNNNIPKTKKQNMPIKVKLPLADDASSRAICAAASGRRQSSARLVASIPRHFSPTYDISLWLPKNQQPMSDTTFQNLVVLANDCCQNIQKIFFQLKDNDGDDDNNDESINNNNDASSLSSPSSFFDYDDDDDDDDNNNNNNGNRNNNNNGINKDNKLQCDISYLREAHTDPKTGNVSQSFQVKYFTRKSLGIGGGGPPEPVCKELAKAVHEEFRRRITTDLDIHVR